MSYAQITGWGKYAPPLLMTNDDMAKIVDTNDEWIFSRSGIRQRHYSHVSTGVALQSDLLITLNSVQILRGLKILLPRQRLF